MKVHRLPTQTCYMKCSEVRWIGRHDNLHIGRMRVATLLAHLRFKPWRVHSQAGRWFLVTKVRY
jgi:hypothetical protein